MARSFCPLPSRTMMWTWSKSTSLTRSRRHSISRRPEPVQQAGGQPGGAVELGQHGAGLLAAEDGRQPLGRLGPHGLVIDPGQRPSQDDLVEEQQGAEGLVLGRGGHVPLHRQVRQERDDFRLAHLQRMPLAVEEDESLRSSGRRHPRCGCCNAIAWSPRGPGRAAWACPCIPRYFPCIAAGIVERSLRTPYL